MEREKLLSGEVKQEPGKEEKKKSDIKSLVAIIPPAHEVLGKKGPRLAEKRIRVRQKPDIKPQYAKINPKLAEDLGIKDYLEVVVARRHKLIFKALFDEKVPESEVWCNEELLKDRGIADNSIATVRKSKKPPMEPEEKKEEEI